MKIVSQILLIALFFSLFGCANIKQDSLREVVRSANPKIKKVIAKANEYEVQIIYTQILRDKNNHVKFKDYTYHLNANNYFYPASTVKFPIALLALEKLNTIDNTSVNTEYEIEGNPNKLQFSAEITKVFAVSDNEASTNLFEFIGFDYLNESMIAKGLPSFRFSHRLSGADSRNLQTKPIRLYKEDNTIVDFPTFQNKALVRLKLNKLQKGIGYMKGNTLENSLFDFSTKNYYSLETLHNTMKRIIFPESFKEKERFHIKEKDREFILFSMQNLPKNAGYNPIEYYDSYGKFFMFGDSKDLIPSSIKIYNKIGQAYGTLTDCAYIVDAENKIEFMVSATILVNKNQIFNDDTYEYEEIGLPFLAELGRQLYDKNKKNKAN